MTDRQVVLLTWKGARYVSRHEPTLLRRIAWLAGWFWFTKVRGGRDAR